MRSFAQMSYLEMLSSSILYPSNQVLRPTKAAGSIKESLDVNSELFNTEALQSNWHDYTKPVRAVARLILGIAIGLFAAPAGVLFHAGATVFYSAMWLKSEGDQVEHNWKKVKDHAGYFFVDLLITLMTLWGVVSIKWLNALWAAGGKRFVIFGLVASGLIPLFCAVAPHHVIPYLFLDRGERAAVYKAVRLKNDFGIVAEDTHGLLPFDPIVDQEKLKDAGSGSLFDLWRCQGFELLGIVTKLNAALPLEHRLISPGNLCWDSDGTGGPGGKDLDEVNGKIDSARRSSITEDKKSTLAALQAEYNALSKNMVKMRELLKGCIEIMLKKIDELFSPPVSLPTFPYKYEHAKSFYEAESNEAKSNKGADRGSAALQSWKNFLDGQNLPDQSSIQAKDFLEIYNALKARKSVLELFGFKTLPTRKELDTRYRRLALVTSPDKHGNEDVATTVLQCLNHARELLATQIKEARS